MWSDAAMLSALTARSPSPRHSRAPAMMCRRAKLLWRPGTASPRRRRQADGESRQSWGGNAFGAVRRRAQRRYFRRKGPTVADNVELIMRFHPVGGEDVSLTTADFAGEAEALRAI